MKNSKFEGSIKNISPTSLRIDIKKVNNKDLLIYLTGVYMPEEFLKSKLLESYNINDVVKGNIVSESEGQFYFVELE